MRAMPEPRNYTRGYLPHRSVPGAAQFVTWRLHDALDAAQWEAWKAEYRGEENEAKLYGLAEKTLDRHEGSAVFRRIDLGRIVMDRLFEGEKDDYRVLAAIVMPNHVHAVLRIERKADLGEVMKAIKGGSAFYVNRAMGREGRLWQPDYFDRLIRNPGHLKRTIEYVHWNPVKAGLCDAPHHYANSTAHAFHAKRLRTEVRGPGAG